jgi:hypothetical protein
VEPEVQEIETAGRDFKAPKGQAQLKMNSQLICVKIREHMTGHRNKRGTHQLLLQHEIKRRLTSVQVTTTIHKVTCILIMFRTKES